MRKIQLHSHVMHLSFAALFGGLLIFLSLFRIYETPSRMYWDQSFLQYTFDQPYPKIEQGLPQFWIAGALQILGKLDEIPLNTCLRMVGAFTFLSAGGILGWFVRDKNNMLSFVLWELALFTSGLQFLWLTSELIAGAFLMLFSLSVFRKWHFVLRAIPLLLFGLTKPDLLFTACLVWAFFSVNNDRPLKNRLFRIYFFLGVIILALLPGIFQSGFDYLKLDGRGLNSLGQHYAALISPLQISKNIPEPWQYYGVYVTSTWGTTNDLFSLILSNPSRYMDFVFLSLATSIRHLVSGLLLFYLPFAVIAYKNIHDQEVRNAVLLLSLNLIPIILLAFYHIRYDARFLPLILFTIFIGMSQIKKAAIRRWILISISILMIVQIPQLINAYSAGYWLVD